jgi:REP element-mobilizing transposase RayT
MPSSFIRIPLHLIWSTKEREPGITAEIGPRLHAYLGGIARERACVPLAIGGVADHVHLLVLLAATISPADLVRDLKSNSSRWVHETFPGAGAFAWQRVYGAFGVSESNVDAVIAYIERQAEHHRHIPFKDEFLSFLERHKVPYDPRYIWE